MALIVALVRLVVIPLKQLGPVGDRLIVHGKLKNIRALEGATLSLVGLGVAGATVLPLRAVFTGTRLMFATLIQVKLRRLNAGHLNAG